MRGGTTGRPSPGGSERAARTTRVPAPSSLRSIKGPTVRSRPLSGRGLFFSLLLLLFGRLERLRALDEVGDLLPALAADALEVARSVLRGHGASTLLPDPAEELGSVLAGRAGAALLSDLLVELRAVLFADQPATHPTGLGDGHAASCFPSHGLLLFAP